MTRGRHAPREPFDTLFTDRRHFRGDCRLMRTALRRGWLDNAPDAVRDALVARFEEAVRADFPARFPKPWAYVRAVLAQTRAALELQRRAGGERPAR